MRLAKEHGLDQVVLDIALKHSDRQSYDQARIISCMAGQY